MRKMPRRGAHATGETSSAASSDDAQQHMISGSTDSEQPAEAGARAATADVARPVTADDPIDRIMQCPICLDDPMMPPIMSMCIDDNSHVVCFKCWKRIDDGKQQCATCRSSTGWPAEMAHNSELYSIFSRSRPARPSHSSQILIASHRSSLPLRIRCHRDG